MQEGCMCWTVPPSLFSVRLNLAREGGWPLKVKRSTQFEKTMSLGVNAICVINDIQPFSDDELSQVGVMWNTCGEWLWRAHALFTWWCSIGALDVVLLWLCVRGHINIESWYYIVHSNSKDTIMTTKWQPLLLWLHCKNVLFCGDTVTRKMIKKHLRERTTAKALC